MILQYNCFSFSSSIIVGSTFVFCTELSLKLYEGPSLVTNTDWPIVWYLFCFKVVFPLTANWSKVQVSEAVRLCSFPAFQALNYSFNVFFHQLFVCHMTSTPAGEFTASLPLSASCCSYIFSLSQWKNSKTRNVENKLYMYTQERFIFIWDENYIVDILSGNNAVQVLLFVVWVRGRCISELFSSLRALDG